MTPPDPRPWRPGGLPVSALVLIGANLVPLVGVIAYDWSILYIMILFWAENVIVGAFNVLRMLFSRGDKDGKAWAKLFMIPFFIVHYGMFTAIHGIIVASIFGRNAPWPDLVAQLRSIGWAGVFLVISHGFSFVHNFLLGGAFRDATLDALMARPYARIVVLHATILAGGVATVVLGAPMAALVVLIVLKTGVDLVAHAREQRAATARS